MNYSLLPSVATVNDILSNFTQSDGFWADSETALSANYNMVKATEPEEQWQSQNFNQSSSIAAAENDTISPLPGQNNLKTTELKRQWQSQDFNQSSSIEKLSRGVVATAGNDTINPLTGQDNVKTTELEQHWQSQDFSQLTSTERFSVGVLAIADNGTINSLPEQNSVDGGVENNLSIFDYSSNTDGVSASSFSSQKQIIVKFKKGITLDQVNQYKSLIGAISSQNISLTGAQSWKLPGSISIDNIIQKYRFNPIFEYIEPDYIITKEDITPQSTFPNDPNFNQLWGLNNTGQSGGVVDADIDAPEAWDIQTGNPNLVIGVIDTGVDYNHPDLVNNIWTNPGEIPGDGIDNDGNGYIDDVHGWDFAYNDNDPMDVQGHGTHVAGTIAGKGNNGIGVTGVAWNAKIMPIKFLNDSGSGYLSDAIAAINYATAQGVKITNNSWGGGGYSQALYDAINAAGQAGALFIAAAGNSSVNTDSNPMYPAAYNLNNIISVASTTRTDSLSWFSNYGSTSVDLGAPGSEIYSTIPVAQGSYGTKSGTSMATPHVTGAAALLWSQNPTWTAQQIKDTLMNTGDPIPALNGNTVSGKRLNVFNALGGLIYLR